MCNLIYMHRIYSSRKVVFTTPVINTFSDKSATPTTLQEKMSITNSPKSLSY